MTNPTTGPEGVVVADNNSGTLLSSPRMTWRVLSEDGTVRELRLWLGRGTVGDINHNSNEEGGQST